MTFLKRFTIWQIIRHLYGQYCHSPYLEYLELVDGRHSAVPSLVCRLFTRILTIYCSGLVLDMGGIRWALSRGDEPYSSRRRNLWCTTVMQLVHLDSPLSSFSLFHLLIFFKFLLIQRFLLSHLLLIIIICVASAVRTQPWLLRPIHICITPCFPPDPHFPHTHPSPGPLSGLLLISSPLHSVTICLSPAVSSAWSFLLRLL